MLPPGDASLIAAEGAPALARPSSRTARGAADRERTPTVRGQKDSFPPLAHIPSLDGVRGLAIVLVLACHFTWGASPNGLIDKIVLHVAWSGWFGVDLFFVLSGFLITRILLAARGGPHYFRNFYIRRTLRIFPLYYAVLAATLILPPLIDGSVRGADWFATLDRFGPWLWSYASNIRLALAGKWEVGGMLGHFWSLAVEEQFYLLWPAVVLLCPPRRFRRLCIAIAIGAVAVRLGLRSIHMPLGAYVLMPARADAFAIGACLAASLRPEIDLGDLHRVARATLAACAAGIGAMFLRRHPLNEQVAGVQVFGYLLLALGFAAMIALAIDSDRQPSLIGRLMRNPVLRFFGKYSYAIYCVHPIVQAGLQDVGLNVHTFPTVAGSNLPGVALYGAIALTITIGLALASWHLVEKHFIRLKKGFPTPRTADAADAAAPPAAPLASSGARA